MNLFDQSRLRELGLTPSDVDSGTLDELVSHSAYLSRQLRDQTNRLDSVWQYEEFGPDIDLTRPDHWARYKHGDFRPIRTNEFAGRLLMTVGATDFWAGLIAGSGLTLYSSANAQIGVGDGSTSASAGNTDLSAAAGSAIQTSGFTSVTTATPIVITNGSGSWTVTPAVGSAVVVSGITTETVVNDTWEVQASGTTTVTLLNSVGSGTAGALASGVMKAINRYFQLVNGTPTHTTNQGVFVAVFASNNANFHAQEWCITNAGVGTGGNLQHAPISPHMFDRVVADNGTKAQGNTATMTATCSLS